MTKRRTKPHTGRPSGSPSPSPVATPPVSSSHHDPVISLAVVSPLQWLFLLASLVLFVVGAVWFFYPFLSERHYRDGFQYDAMGLYELAIKELEQAVRYTPWETQYIMTLAKSYESLAAQASLSVPDRLAALDKAELLYQDCVDLDPLNPWQQNRLAAVWTARAALLPTQDAQLYLEKATRAIQFAAKLDAQNPLFQLNYAHHLHTNNRLDEALPLYLMAIEMDPNMMEARYNLADLYRRRNQLDLTLAQYEYIYSKNPDFANINVGLADTYSRLNRIDEAIDAMDREIKRRPDFVEGITFLITLHSKKQQWEQVAALYFQLIALNPGSDAYFLPFVEAVRRSGKVDKAKANLQQMMAQNPNPDLQRLLQLL